MLQLRPLRRLPCMRLLCLLCLPCPLCLLPLASLLNSTCKAHRHPRRRRPRPGRCRSRTWRSTACWTTYPASGLMYACPRSGVSHTNRPTCGLAPPAQYAPSLSSLQLSLCEHCAGVPLAYATGRDRRLLRCMQGRCSCTVATYRQACAPAGIPSVACSTAELDSSVLPAQCF